MFTTDSLIEQAQQEAAELQRKAISTTNKEELKLILKAQIKALDKYLELIESNPDKGQS